jgi:hypothetical protein
VTFPPRLADALLWDSIGARFSRWFLSSGSSKDMRGKLTKRSVEALKSDVRDQFIWDTEIPGFGCKITPMLIPLDVAHPSGMISPTVPI